MQSGHSTDGERNVSHTKVGEMAIPDEEDGGRKQQTGPCHNYAHIGHAKSIGVVSESHVVALGVGKALKMNALVEGINGARSSASTGSK